MIRRDFFAFAAGAVAARTVLPIAAKAQPDTADMPDLLDRYSAWLEAERLALMREQYPDCDLWEAARYVPACPYSRATLLGRMPPPSARVLAVLGAAGVWTGPYTVEARRAVYQRVRGVA